MTEQIEKILAELKAVQAKLPELRDLFWLKIDRYSESDQQRGVAFDEKFEQQRNKLFRVIDSFTAFIEKSFAPTDEEVTREKALQKLRAEFPGFDEWNEEAKKALLEREIKDILIARNAISDNAMGFSKRRIKEELQNITILYGNKFSDEFMKFYNNLDPTPATHNSQKFLVRNYLLEQGYDENLVNSIKGFIPKASPTKLIVTFPDGTEISDKIAARTLAKTIKKIGTEKVIALNLIVNKAAFVSQDKDSLHTATFVENG
ncbi:MAG: hypothetical protein LBL57_04595, partial [Tannerella sp.]|nr:hypothetical protein [Tannerella sp.]